MEEGSGGLLNDLTFYGGKIGANLGNQQYTARNLQFYGCDTAISQLWDWGWTYKSLVVEDCGVGIEMVDNNTASITLLDSEFSRVGDAIRTTRQGDETDPKAAGSLVLENVRFSEVEAVLTGVDGVIIPGEPTGEVHVRGYADVSFVSCWRRSWVDADGYRAMCMTPSGRPYTRGATARTSRGPLRSSMATSTTKSPRFVSHPSFHAFHANVPANL